MQATTSIHRLNAEHQPRMLRAKGLGPAFDEPQRISRADEQVLTKRVHDVEDEAVSRTRGEMAANLTGLEADLRTELLKLRDPRIRPTRQSHRDLGNALVLIGKVRRALTPTS